MDKFIDANKSSNRLSATDHTISRLKEIYSNKQIDRRTTTKNDNTENMQNILKRVHAEDHPLPIVKLVDVNSGNVLPDAPSDKSIEEEIFGTFSPELQSSINEVLNTNLNELLQNLPNVTLGEENEDEISYQSSHSSSSTRSISRRRAYVENYWCDFCADDLFMHNESAIKRIEDIIRRNKLTDKDGNLINPTFFTTSKTEAHQLGVILGLSPVCKFFMSNEYPKIYDKYANALSMRNAPCHAYVSKGIIYEYNKGYYSKQEINIQDVNSIRTHQLSHGIECVECKMIACPFHRKYSNFNMATDTCGWCDAVSDSDESFVSTSTAAELDGTVFFELDDDNDSD
jgi:hypothetical protein